MVSKLRIIWKQTVVATEAEAEDKKGQPLSKDTVAVGLSVKRLSFAHLPGGGEVGTVQRKSGQKVKVEWGATGAQGGKEWVLCTELYAA